MLEEYHKIESLYERNHENKKLIEGRFVNPTVDYLKDNVWLFTEKIDGTNIRVFWDGHKVSFWGRTDKAQIPQKLANRLMQLFGGETNEQLFEQKFGDTPVMLVGEGYGAGIQGVGGLYSSEQDFILFDVMIAGNWQPRESVDDIACYFNLKLVPIALVGTIQHAVDYVKTKPMSAIGKAPSEGVVGRPFLELKDRTGKRVIVKIKVRDFE